MGDQRYGDEVYTDASKIHVRGEAATIFIGWQPITISKLYGPLSVEDVRVSLTPDGDWLIEHWRGNGDGTGVWIQAAKFPGDPDDNDRE